MNCKNPPAAARRASGWVVVFFLFSAVARGDGLGLVMKTPPNPSSRFPGFTAEIPSAAALLLVKSSLRFVLDDLDRTGELSVEEDPSTGTWRLLFSPGKPLPVRELSAEVRVLRSDGAELRQTFVLLVDPARDPELTAAVESVRKNPRNPAAHFELGKAYESKRLFQDAAYEYGESVALDPSRAEYRLAYERVVSFWDRKEATHDGITVEVSLHRGLFLAGGPVAFRVRILNQGAEEVQVFPDQSVLLDETRQQFSPLADLDLYLKESASQENLSLQTYTRLRHLLDTQSMPRLPMLTLQPGGAVEGFLFFSRTRTARVELVVKTAQAAFRFPFVLSE